MRALLVTVLFALVWVGPLTAATPPRMPVSLVVNPFLNNAPIFIAQHEGYFAAQGLELRPVVIRDATQAWPAMIAGQLDIYTGIVNAGFFQAISQGARLRIVADKGHAAAGDRSSTFMVRQDLIDSGRFRTLRDLRGMRIARSGGASIYDLFRLRLLRDRALLTLQDVILVDVPSTFAVQALAARAIDALVAGEPDVTRLETLRLAKGVVTMHDLLPGAQLTVITYGPRLLSHNPGAGQRFMTAYLQGVRRHLEGKTERNLAVIQQATGHDPDLLRKMGWSAVHADGRVNVESLLQLQRWWVSEGWLETVVPPERYLDLSFARRAAQAATRRP